MNLSKDLKAIEDKRMAAENELREIERLIFKLETNYLKDASIDGNVIRGWDALINQKASKNSGYLGRKYSNKPYSEKDRIFSMSSATIPYKLAEDEFQDGQLPLKRKLNIGGKNTLIKRKSKRRLEDDGDYSEGTIN
ncbi:unnamed protein product [Blepharisma stoltei]|uniref:Chromatin modification-related protein MEAF6 n=1 Tax=Blepharisma stoltei TaxID=1481888 RepID=A0AAU9IR57_9CILI|nr:unnamed protein product [Blepharisma stoltei]